MPAGGRYSRLSAVAHGVRLGTTRVAPSSMPPHFFPRGQAIVDTGHNTRQPAVDVLRYLGAVQGLPGVAPADIEALFDAIPDVLFFIKDEAGLYTHVNITMVRRLGLKSRSEVIGKRVNEVYPGGLSATYARQDNQVLAGETIENLLELHIFPNRAPGWCLTCKRPLYADGRVAGVIGISRDLGPPDGRGSIYERLRMALAHLNVHYAENVRIQTLIELTGFSASKLQRYFRQVFQLTPQQVLTRLRIQMAIHRMRGDENIASIGQSCGFTDQSAFTRQFKATVGVTPRDYRALLRKDAPLP